MISQGETEEGSVVHKSDNNCGSITSYRHRCGRVRVPHKITTLKRTMSVSIEGQGLQEIF